MTRAERVTGSVLWAAWADALGFITELGDAGTVKWRVGAERVDDTVKWRRKIGGSFGAVVPMSPGTYSDDTQLRLATSRSIRSDGTFDVEAFAKIELPVFLSYSLGAGRGTKAAADALNRSAQTWCTNFFDNKAGHYVNGGGNGAAMRIQPHIWSAPNSASDTWLPMVVRNAVTTHGHMRGIAGAVVHGFALAVALEEGRVPTPDDWYDTLGVVGRIPEAIRNDEELATLWLPTWERLTGSSVDVAVGAVVTECQELIKVLAAVDRSMQAWRPVLEEAGGLDEKSRGSATVTALAACSLAFLGREAPAIALREAANTLGSDTDTIATMAGAILGAALGGEPPGPVQDDKFLRKEAHRLTGVSERKARSTYRYPDLMNWAPPKAALDLVGLTEDGGLALAGMGRLRPVAKELRGTGKADTVWQWCELPFGQTVLVRRRADPRSIDQRLLPLGVNTASTATPAQEGSEDPRDLFSQLDAPMDIRERRGAPKSGEAQRVAEGRGRRARPNHEVIRADQSVRQPENRDLDTLVDLVVGSGFPEVLVGEILLGIAAAPHGTERAAAFAAAVARAARQRTAGDT